MATSDGGDDLPERFQDYEVGDARDALVSDEVDRVYISDDDEQKVWWFDLRSISWFKKNRILSDSVNQDPETGEGSLDVSGYYRDVMLAKCVDWSGSDQMPLQEFLTGLDDDLGSQLEAHLPDPGAVSVEEDEEGKSETQSDSESSTTQPE